MENTEDLVRLEHELHTKLVRLAEIDKDYSEATAAATKCAVRADTEYEARLETADEAQRTRNLETAKADEEARAHFEADHEAAASALESLASSVSRPEIAEAASFASPTETGSIQMEPDPQAVLTAARDAEDDVRRAWQQYQADAASRSWLSLRVLALVLLVTVVLAVAAAWIS